MNGYPDFDGSRYLHDEFYGEPHQIEEDEPMNEYKTTLLYNPSNNEEMYRIDYHQKEKETPFYSLSLYKVRNPFPAVRFQRVIGTFDTLDDIVETYPEFSDQKLYSVDDVHIL